MIGSGLVVFDKAYESWAIRKRFESSCNTGLPIEENLMVDIWFWTLGSLGCLGTSWTYPGEVLDLSRSRYSPCSEIRCPKY